MNHITSAITRAMITVRLIPNAKLDVNALNPSGNPRIDRLLDNQTANAVSTEDIPRVAMKLSIWTLTTKNPFSAPIASPNANANAIASGGDHPASVIPHPAITDETEILPAIDRSNTPADNGISNPRETTTKMAFWFSTERCVNHMNQVSGTHSEKMIQINANR